MGCPAARAEAPYPNDRIKIIVPLAAGGGGDIVARLVAQAMAKVLGQAVYVENHPGANGIIGSRIAAVAPADGYSIMMGSTGTHSVNQFLYKRLSYDPVRQFIPVTLIADYNNILVVPASSPVKSLKDLIQYAKDHPGKLSYGITVIGNSAHLATEQFKHEAGFEALGIPYDSTAKAIVDLLGGRLDFMIDTILTQHGAIKGGKVRPLATTAAKRSREFPDVPTLAESGFADIDTVGWLGLFVQTGTPQSVVDKIFSAINQAFKTPELEHASQATPGLDLVPSASPQDFARYVAAERVRWSAVIKASNIKIE